MTKQTHKLPEKISNTHFSNLESLVLLKTLNNIIDYLEEHEKEYRSTEIETKSRDVLMTIGKPGENLLITPGKVIRDNKQEDWEDQFEDFYYFEDEIDLGELLDTIKNRIKYWISQARVDERKKTIKEILFDGF